MSILKISNQWKNIKPIVKFMEDKFGKKQIRLVGGSVRDLLLDRKVNDLDFATKHTPEKIISLCKEHGFKYFLTGIEHGTITVQFDFENKKHTCEITTLRQDVLTDGRHAKVEYTNSWKEDAARRDFTINAMYLNSDSSVIDYFSGWKDLKNKDLKFVGHPAKRIKEDYLRILRLFRFEHTLGFDIDKQTIKICKDLSKNLDKISKERILSEIKKVTNGFYSVETNCNFFKRLFDVCAFVSLGFPKLNLNKKGINFYIKSLPYALVNFDISSDSINDFAKNFKLSNNDLNDIKYLLSILEKTKKMKTNEEFRKYGIRLKHEYVNTGKLSKNELENFLNFAGNVFWEKHGTKPYVDLREGFAKTFAVTGHDILSLGIPEGKHIKFMLNALYDKWELSNYTLTKEDLLKSIG